jgi:hypothetical protein
MSVPTAGQLRTEGRIPEAGVLERMGALQRAMQFIMQCISAAPANDTLCVIWELCEATSVHSSARRPD